jgi:hypothetical protein
MFPVESIIMSTESNPPTKKELAGILLAQYATADEAVNRAKEALDEANKVRSEIVKEIDKKIGKGPFEYKGVYLGVVVHRGSTAFFRGKGENGTMKID